MSSQPPKVTVILPVYNADTTLKRAVDSVLKQSFQEFELIIVDNNSTDNSLKIARTCANQDSRIQIIKEPRQGVVPAFNKGLENAVAPCIARMDADDEMLVDRLLLQFNFLEKNTAFDAVGGLATYIPHHQNTKGFADYVRWSNSLLSDKEIVLNRFVEMPVINPTTMWRKSISDRLGAYREGDFPEDYEMWLRWMDEGIKVGKVNHPVLRWHDSDNRLTRTDEKYSKEAFHRVRVKYLAKHLKKSNPFHPKVWVWGAARQTRRYAGMMEPYGINIEKYIDVNRRISISKEVVHYTQLPAPGTCFILVYVKSPSARQRIIKFLGASGYRRMEHFLLVM